MTDALDDVRDGIPRKKGAGGGELLHQDPQAGWLLPTPA